MNRKNLLLVTGFLIIVVALIVSYLEIRAEPVSEISRKWDASGHADRTSESFVHWDEDEPAVIPASCAKCHSSYGYAGFLGVDGSAAGEVNTEATIGSVVDCTVCHNNVAHEMDSVIFPSGDEATGTGAASSCMQCHQGRESTVSVNAALSDLPDDAISEDLGFINVHYAVAAATQMGAEAQGAYQYPGRTYVGFFEHAEGLQACSECHDPHSLAITPQECSPCHLNVVDHGDLRDIRSHQADYDGDGNMTEGVDKEIGVLHAALLDAIQEYAGTVIEAPIVYGSSFPYFMNDTDGDGEADADEVNFGNRYASWTPRLMRAAYNYHYVNEDPGAFAHNPSYVVQILYDSLEDLGQQVPVEMSSFIRPSAQDR